MFLKLSTSMKKKYSRALPCRDSARECSDSRNWRRSLIPVTGSSETISCREFRYTSI